jgi:hypothetical protein
MKRDRIRTTIWFRTAIIPEFRQHVPASQNGISLTKRFESFGLLPVPSDHKLSKDVSLSVTIISNSGDLMGMHKLDEIVRLYQKKNRSFYPLPSFKTEQLQ